MLFQQKLMSYSVSSYTDTPTYNPFDLKLPDATIKNIALIYVLLSGQFLRTQTLSHTSSKMGLYTEVLLFVLLNGDSNRAMRFQCMIIRFRSQTEDLISFNKQVISGVENEHKAVVKISKVKNKGILLHFSHSFELFQGISKKLFRICPRVKNYRPTLQK